MEAWHKATRKACLTFFNFNSHGHDIAYSHIMSLLTTQDMSPQLAHTDSMTVAAGRSATYKYVTSTPYYQRPPSHFYFTVILL